MNKAKKMEKNPRPGGVFPVRWCGATPADRKTLEGHHARVRPLQARSDARALWNAFGEDSEGAGWTWLPYGPFDDFTAFVDWLQRMEESQDPLFFAIQSREAPAHEVHGLAAFLRMDAVHGVIEIGHIHFAPVLQRSRAATEALYLMMRCAFDDWGYRRLEWKCDARNRPSRHAAERLGFTHEGLFRQHMIVKGRNRDTVGYAIIDGEWPLLRRALESWLDDDNFDGAGRQRRRLAELRERLQTAPGDL